MNTNIADIVFGADTAFRNADVDIADIHSSVTATANAGYTNLTHVHSDPRREACRNFQDPFVVDLVAIPGKIKRQHFGMPILAKVDQIRSPGFPAEEVP